MPRHGGYGSGQGRKTMGKTWPAQGGVLSLAAEDIAEKHKYDAAANQDSLPVLVALARLMDQHNPKVKDFGRLGKKLECAKLVGDEWQAVKYASAKKTNSRMQYVRQHWATFKKKCRDSSKLLRRQPRLERTRPLKRHWKLSLKNSFQAHLRASIYCG